MATIILEIANIPGESTKGGYAGKLDVLAIRDSIEVVSAYKSSGGTRATRTLSATKLSDIELVRKRDKGSPLLARACAAGTDLGTVTISVLKTVGRGLKPYMVFTLTGTYVSRYESETDDESGRAYQPQIRSQGSSQPSLPPAFVGAMSLIGGESGRPSPRALLPFPPSEARNIEVERLWLNASSVRWTYTPYTGTVAGGAVENTWNIASTSDSAEA